VAGWTLVTGMRVLRLGELMDRRWNNDRMLNGHPTVIAGRAGHRHALWAVCCAISLVALIAPARAGAVIGGKVIHARQYPGIAQVVVNDLIGGEGTICGGGLIAPRVVVTAGHCFLNVPIRRLRPVSVVFARQWK
jgi:hypothetical protein